MIRPRVSIRTILLLIVPIALGLAALRYPYEPSVAAMHFVTIAVLATAGTAAVLDLGRPVAVGIVFFGGGFYVTLLLYSTSPFSYMFPPEWTNWLFERLHPTTAKLDPKTGDRDSMSSAFSVILEFVLILTFASFGGIVGAILGRIAARKRQHKEPPAALSTP
jgi:hypothetical protein